MKNKKGFTLIELLTVIVILTILLLVSVPAVTKYIDSSRKDTYVVDVAQAINSVRTDALKTGVSEEKVYTFTEINALLDKKLVESPYGNNYDDDSYIKVVVENDKPTYKVCIVDIEGNGIYNSYTIDKSLFVSGNPNNDYCHAEDDLSIPACTWTGPYSDSALTTSLTELSQNATVYFGLTCTDDVELSNGLQVAELTSSNSVVLSNITIVSSTETSTTQYEYVISAATSYSIGSATISLAADAIKDRSNKGNTQTTSSSTSLSKIYVYKEGEEYSSFTGGWNFTAATNYGGYSRNQDNEIQVYVVDANTWTLSSACTNNAIDVTNYTALKFNVTQASIIGSSSYSFKQIGLSNSNSRMGSSGSTVREGTCNVGLVTINVSDLTGSYYVCTEEWQVTAGTGNSGGAKVHFNRAYFE